jgi:hypothetical protein
MREETLGPSPLFTPIKRSHTTGRFRQMEQPLVKVDLVPDRIGGGW